MDKVLIDSWLLGLDALPTLDAASVAAARETVRACGAAAGLEAAVIERVAAAASELLVNQLRHARRGMFAVRAVKRGAVPGVEIVAADQGRGLEDPARALDGTSLGAGMATARRLTDEMDIDTRAGEGTCIRARTFAEPVPRRREVGVVGRALAGELVSGDHGAFVRGDETLTMAVADGIGHGPPAHEASAQAIAAFLADPRAGTTSILTSSDMAVQSTRGAVMSVARLDEGTRVIDYAGVGNVTMRVERWRSSRLLTGSSATLGGRGLRRKPLTEFVTVEPGEVILMYTDGLTTRVDLSGEPDLLREHAVVIAQRVMMGFGRPNDDGLVMVAK